MKSKNNILLGIWDIYKYRINEYPILYVALFFSVIFEVVGLSSKIGVSDVLYFFFASFFFIKSLLKKHRRDSGSVLIYPTLFILLILISYFSFGIGRMFMSQLRFVYNCTLFILIFYYFRNTNSDENRKLISSYIYVCVIASTFIIIQNISFYIFHYTIKFDIGNFNAASTYIFSSSAFYRTGGFFNEPSWFALFTGPVLEISYRQKKIRELFICVLGLVLSTSSMAFLFLFIFAITKMKYGNMKGAILILAFVAFIYYVFPLAFNRLFEALSFNEGENSNEARVFRPFAYAFSSSLPIFGRDISNVVGETLFLNTFIFVLLSFGIVGLIIFIIMILQRNSLCLSLIILFGVIIEGCYGRVDFWMSLLATSAFCYGLRARAKRRMFISA